MINLYKASHLDIEILILSNECLKFLLLFTYVQWNILLIFVRLVIFNMANVIFSSTNLILTYIPM